MYDDPIRQAALDKLIHSSAGAFKRWSCVLRYSRTDKVHLIKTRLKPLSPNERVSQFNKIAGQLSGSESLFAQWTFNLFGDDPTRGIGETI